MNTTLITRYTLAWMMSAVLLVPLAALAEKPENSALKDAWLDGKLETALLLNEHLNAFDINTDVENGKATLTGKVASDVAKELAEEIAKSVSGVTAVDNKLSVVEVAETSPPKDSDRNFVSFFKDASTTAAIKSKLLFGSEVKGMNIDISTSNGVVTLKGEVKSEAEHDLVMQIVKNMDGVKSVRDELKVVS